MARGIVEEFARPAPAALALLRPAIGALALASRRRPAA